MFADAALHERLQRVHRAYFAELASAIRTAGLSSDPYLQLDGTIACFAGEGSPLTQGNGRFEAHQIDAVNAFFRGKASSWEAVLTPFDGPAAVGRIIAAGGQPSTWENVLYRPTALPVEEGSKQEAIEVREVAPEEIPLWCELSTRGFTNDHPDEIARTLQRILEHASIRRYLATYKGTPAAVAGMNVYEGVAFFGGGATLASYRRKGLQAALIRRRLEDAAASAEVAVMGATPVSSSHRNAERAGFRIAHAQVSFRVPTPG